MRLLLIADRFPPDIGGVARSALRTASVLHTLGVVDVEVLAWTRTLPPGELETTPLAVEERPDLPLRVHHLGLFSNQDFSLQHTQNVVEWLHGEHPYSALWGHYLYPAGYMAVLLAAWLDIPATVSARGNDVDRLLFPPGDFARLQWTLERADLITSVSEDLAKKIRILLRHEVADIHLLGNAVDPETFCPGPPDPTLQAKLGITPDGHELVLGFCGELRQKKGFPFLLRALETVHQVRPAKLVVIGEVRPREKIALDEFIADVPDLKEHLILAGHQEEPNEVARHLRICDLLLHPSVWDGLPNALLESMACGKLVLASDAGGIPEVIEHGTNGCLLPRAELPRLGEAILELDSLPHSQKTAIESAARESIRQGHSPAHEREKLQQVLRDLLKNTS